LYIPTDNSVIGFDNILQGRPHLPVLGIIDIPRRRIGRQGVGMLNMMTKNTDDGIGSIII
jgi:DNA-binding LacI/PurR family transcriptional regulator